MIINYLKNIYFDIKAFFILKHPLATMIFDPPFNLKPIFCMMKTYLVLFLILCVSGNLLAQTPYWEEVKGPEGGEAVIVPTQTSTVYALFTHKIFRSDDYGVTWNKITVSDIDTLDSSNEYLTVGYSGLFYKLWENWDQDNLVWVQKLYISNNDGASWTLQNGNVQLQKVFELPSGTLLGIYASSLYRSTDQGVTWQLTIASNSQIVNPLASYLSVSNNGHALISANTYHKFIYTTDDGATWAEGTCPVAKGIHSINQNGSIFCIKKSDGFVAMYRSTDGGSNWELSFANEQIQSITQGNNQKLLITTSVFTPSTSGSIKRVKLYESTDDGITWTELPASLNQPVKFATNFPLNNGDLLGYSKGFLAKSSDDGQNWQASATGMHAADIKAFKAFDANAYYAVTESGFWTTTNGGDNWTKVLADLSDVISSSYALAVINQDSFAVQLGDSTWLTSNGGQTFQNVTLPGTRTYSLSAISEDTGGILAMNVADSLWIMDSLNGSWRLSLAGIYHHYFVKHLPTGDLFVTGVDSTLSFSGIWKSTDNGVSWSKLPNFELDIVFRMISDQHGNLICLGSDQQQIYKLAISSDGGTTWHYQLSPSNFFQGMLRSNRLGHLFLIDFSIGNFPLYSQIATSVDMGMSWYNIPVDPKIAFKNLDYQNLDVSEDGYLFIRNISDIFLKSTKSTESGAYIHATVNRDADLDCSTPDAQEPLKNWNITVSGEEDYYGTTNANGYCTFYLDTAVYTVTARTPQALWWSLCDSVQTVEATLAMGSDTVPFVALPLAECPLMSVNVAAPMLRRCFNNTVYINYCNQGTEPADSAWVDVMLDEYLSFISSAQPYDSLGNNVYRFYLGDVNNGDCGDFNLTVYVSCDSTVLGQTHCISAHIFPDTLCTPTPNWSGANIEASVTCQDTLVQFKLENTGQSPSSTLEYIIIEDDVVLFTGQKSYAPGESILLDYDANGSTWRIESMQEPGHPFSYLALAFEEGCGGFESLGFINQFPVNGSSPSYHQTCISNIGAFDPNDKQGFPTGVGEDHNIRPGQELEYLIRFQNTGTDTAFNVMIRDTLSAFLDPASVRPGASSHPYTWSLSGEGVITFMFKNILLPDSNINEPASHGFVQFRIAQQPNLPLGSVIENDAAIYFDFNAPIITNTTWHTLFDGPLMSAINEPGHNRTQQSLEIWPNPVKDQTSVRLKKASAGNKRVNLYNSTGQILQSLHFTGQETILKCPSLAPGQYWIQVTDVQGRTLGSSVLVKE
ncbi:MAG TPA: hypothetical protein DCF33_03085 [Saprospirales bacterium]|nr:hypothetical protein [Saprospirales bacterium]